MKKITLALITCLISFCSYSQDTFSIIAVDPDTGEVGSAGASCVVGIGAQGIIDIITDIIPGKGGVNSQAFVCIPNTNLQNAIIRMEAGDDPNQIINWLINNDSCASQNFDPAFRQYGVADLDNNNNPRTAGFTGVNTNPYTEDRQGATYSIQGNILLNQSVLDGMENNFNSTSGTLADKLMAAMQGANIPGADSRCLSAGTSSTTAYLTVYAADDTPGNPSIRLNIGEQPTGTEPIDLLQDAYDEFLSVEENDLSNLTLSPNPAGDFFQITGSVNTTIKNIDLYDVIGKKIDMNIPNSLNTPVTVKSLPNGVYFVKISTASNSQTLRFIKN